MRVFVIICAVILNLGLASCSQSPKSHQSTSVADHQLEFISSSKKMMKIDSGSYRAFIGKDSNNIIKVKSFYIDDSPVTNAEYLTFLKANPQWTRSKVLRLYADSTYLKHWKGDYQLPEKINPDAPVTNVSWFAAEAYAKSVGKRLPTIEEWEYVGLADRTSKNASDKPDFTDFILREYQQRKSNMNKVVRQGEPNFYGVYDMYGMVWEWTYDFNSVMMSGESRKDNTTNESLFCAGGAITASDLRNYAAFVRYALRGSIKANNCLNNLGFRCARDFKN